MADEATPKQPDILRYGSEVELRHETTQGFLTAPGSPYSPPTPSTQNRVVCLAQSTARSIWIITSPDSCPKEQFLGMPLQNGWTIRLENRADGQNCHSHDIPAPVTRTEQEVTCYGNRGIGDFNDNWRVECDPTGPLTTGTHFRLIHCKTEKALHSHKVTLQTREQEVTAYAKRNNDDYWTVPALLGGPTVSSTDLPAHILEKQTQAIMEQARNAQKDLQQVKSETDLSSQRLKDLSEIIDKEKGRLDAAIARYEKQFSESQEARRKETQANEEAFNGKFLELLAITKASSQAEIGKFQEQAKGVLVELKTILEEAKRVASVIGKVAVGYEYQQLADFEEKQANTFRRVSFILLLGIVLAVVILVVDLPKQTTDWWKTVFLRYSTIILMLLPAFYAMRESSHHRKTQRRYRRMHLELSAVQPFVANLSPEWQDELRLYLAKRIFGQAEPEEENPPGLDKEGAAIVEKVLEQSGDITKTAIKTLGKP